MDIVPETVNRIRLSNDDLFLLRQLLEKVDKSKLTYNENQFLEILYKRVNGRIKLNTELRHE